MCSSRCSGKEFYSGLENRISLKRTWWRGGVVAGRFVRAGSGLFVK